MNWLRSTTSTIIYYVLDRFLGFLGIFMIVALLAFALPVHALVVLVIAVLLLAYIVIALFLVIAQWG